MCPLNGKKKTIKWVINDPLIRATASDKIIFNVKNRCRL